VSFCSGSTQVALRALNWFGFNNGATAPDGLYAVKKISHLQLLASAAYMPADCCLIGPVRISVLPLHIQRDGPGNAHSNPLRTVLLQTCSGLDGNDSGHGQRGAPHEAAGLQRRAAAIWVC